MPPGGSIFAKAKGGGKPSPAVDMADEAMGDEYEDSKSTELPPDFESYALEAFPELEGDDARLQSLWKAVKACVKA